MNDDRAPIWPMLLFAALAILAIDRSCNAEASAKPWRYTLASQFGSTRIGDPLKGITHDRYQGHVFFCTGRKTKPLRWGVAHRTLPCGSVVEVCKGKLCVMAPVVTTGPFWAIPTTCRPRWSQKCWGRGKPIVRRRLRSPVWRFAGDLDLLPRVAWAIRLGGKAVVRWRVVYAPRRKHE